MVEIKFMYYEEQIVNCVLCWRNNPYGNWTPFSIQELTNKIKQLQVYGTEEYVRGYKDASEIAINSVQQIKTLFDQWFESGK
jgi:hypothetical protein